MGIFEQFPYTNFHELNLDWILKALKELEHTIEQFVSINALKYADPIQWNITSQYEKNTIVIDPQTGTAYISVQPVPAGVALTNTDYWTVVFDLGSFVTRAAQNFTSRWEEETTLTATFSTNAGDWLVWGDVLYIALVNITAGDTYVVNSNIRHFTIEDLSGHLSDLITADKSNLVNAINECIGDIVAIENSIGNLTNLTTADKTSIVNAINECISDIVSITNNIGNLANLTTADKTSIVNAINECISDIVSITNNIGNLANLTTADKTSIVNAINECIWDINLLRNRRFVLIGDSYLQGATWHSDGTWTYDTPNWGDFFCNILGLNIADVPRLAVGGAGFAGETNQGTWVSRFPAFAATVSDPDTVTDVIIVGGINDAVFATISDVMSAMPTMFNLIHGAFVNAHVHVGYAGVDKFDLPTQEKSYAMRNTYALAAAQGPYATYLAGLEFVLQELSYLQNDGVHPNGVGNNFLANYIINSLIGNYVGVPHGVENYTLTSAFITNTLNLKSYRKDEFGQLINRDNQIISLTTAVSGTFNGTVAFELVTLPTSNCFIYGQPDSSGDSNIVDSVPSIFYVSVGGTPTVQQGIAQICIANGRLYVKPIIIDSSGSYVNGTCDTFILPKFTLTVNTLLS